MNIWSRYNFNDGIKLKMDKNSNTLLNKQLIEESIGGDLPSAP